MAGWQRVGEHITDILVNSTQEASYTQNSDSNYDVDVSATKSWGWNQVKQLSPANDDSTTSAYTLAASSAPIFYKIVIDHTGGYQYNATGNISDTNGDLGEVLSVDPGDTAQGFIFLTPGTFRNRQSTANYPPPVGYHVNDQDVDISLTGDSETTMTIYEATNAVFPDPESGGDDSLGLPEPGASVTVNGVTKS